METPWVWTTGRTLQYVANTTRGDTYSVLAATTFDGWLPCSVLKKGYYNKDQVYQFITEFLIPCLKETYGDAGRLIIRDNVQIHCDKAVRNALKKAGYMFQYLPPYSPDFNPIELSFSVIM